MKIFRDKLITSESLYYLYSNNLHDHIVVCDGIEYYYGLKLVVLEDSTVFVDKVFNRQSYLIDYCELIYEYDLLPCSCPSKMNNIAYNYAVMNEWVLRRLLSYMAMDVQA